MGTDVRLRQTLANEINISIATKVENQRIFSAIHRSTQTQLCQLLFDTVQIPDQH